MVFYPDIMVSKITDINNEILNNFNINSILLDIDDTISPSNKADISEEILNWIFTIQNKKNKVALISNNSKERVEYFAKKLAVPYIHKAMKPFPFGINKAIRLISAKKDSTVLIGDQIFTDVIGARLCGIKSILVEPLNKDGSLFLKFKRSIESRIRSNIKYRLDK